MLMVKKSIQDGEDGGSDGADRGGRGAQLLASYLEEGKLV